MNLDRLLPHATLVLAAALAAPAARADDPNAALRYASLGVQRDANDNQSVLATLSLPLGQRQWVQLSGGRTRLEQGGAAQRAGVIGVGAGTLGDGWAAALNATQRRDGDRFRQTDWLATIEWRGEVVDFGLDGSHRDARRQAAALPSTQRVKGGGLGLHGGVMLGEATRLYAAAMHYDLRSEGGSATPPPTLLQSLAGRSPVVARDELALRRSVQAGLGHRIGAISLNVEYLGDTLLDTPGRVHTVQLKAGFEPVPGWTLAPAVGRSRDGNEGVNFAALSLTRRW